MTKKKVIQIVQAQAQKVKALAQKDKKDGVAHGAIYTLPFAISVKEIVGYKLYYEYSHTIPPASCRDPKAGVPEEKTFYGLHFTKELQLIAEITTCQLLPHQSGYSPYNDWHDQPDYTKKLYSAFTIECEDGTLTHDELNSLLSTLE